MRYIVAHCMGGTESDTLNEAVDAGMIAVCPMIRKLVRKNRHSKSKTIKEFPAITRVVFIADEPAVIAKLRHVSSLLLVAGEPRTVTEEELTTLCQTADRFSYKEPSSTTLSVGSLVRAVDTVFGDFVGRITKMNNVQAEVEPLFDKFPFVVAFGLDFLTEISEEDLATLDQMPAQ